MRTIPNVDFKRGTGSKKEAESIIENIIKIVIKINILARNEQFTSNELKIAGKIRNKFSVIIKTVISFFEVEFSFDKNFLKKNIGECQQLLIELVNNHLTSKSLGRIDRVFNFCKQDAFLEEMFRRESPHRPLLQTIIDDMNKAIDSGEF